jgi:bacillithiol biosynthesis deacetylase BshB1
MNESLDILAMSTHPDDAELGCGGSLIVAVEAGYRVGIADLTEGERSSRGNPTQRQGEKETAAAVLGLTQRYSVGLPDTQIGTDPSHEATIIQLIRQTRPRIVLVPYWQDRHPDHVAAAQCIQRAVFFAGVTRVGNGRPYRPQQLIYYMHHYPFQPSFVLDVSDVWRQRMTAVKAYTSQFHVAVSTDKSSEKEQTALSGSDFLRFIEARAIWFGAMIGAAYGEPFLSTGPVAAIEFPGLQKRNMEVSSFYRMF